MPIFASPKTGAGTSGADFDGASAYLSRASDLDSNADSKLWSFSAWLSLDAGSGVGCHLLQNQSSRFQIQRASGDNRIYFTAFDGASLFSIFASPLLSSAGFIHLMASGNTGTGTYNLYRDDSDDLNLSYTNDRIIDFTKSSWGLGAQTSGGTPWNGVISEFWFAPGEFIDFSVEANRRKFITAGGRPVSLGSDGSLPTGNQPAIYMPNPINGINLGYGGDFTVNGSPIRSPGPVSGSESRIIPHGRRF